MGRYLQYLKEKGQIVDWEHEPHTFWFEGIRRGCVSYKPDYRVTRRDGSHYWIEVKGFMDAKSRTKIRRFAKYFPSEKLEVIDTNRFAVFASGFSKFISSWE